MLVNNLLQHVKLIIYFLGDLILKAFLIEYALLHLSAFTKICRAHQMYVLQKVDLFRGSLLQRESCAPFILLLEVAVITECCVVSRRIYLKFVFVFAELYALVLYHDNSIDNQINDLPVPGN